MQAPREAGLQRPRLVLVDPCPNFSVKCDGFLSGSSVSVTFSLTAVGWRKLSQRRAQPWVFTGWVMEGSRSWELDRLLSHSWNWRRR